MGGSGRRKYVKIRRGLYTHTHTLPVKSFCTVWFLMFFKKFSSAQACIYSSCFIVMKSVIMKSHTFGFQTLDFFRSNFRALVYSACILRAGTTSSPSDFVTTTKSAISMIPLLIPFLKIQYKPLSARLPQTNLHHIRITDNIKQNSFRKSG